MRGRQAQARAEHPPAAALPPEDARLQARPLVYDADPSAPLSREKQAVLARLGSARRVLEVGAHTGAFSAVLGRRGASVTALELDPRAARHARGRADQVVVGDVEDPAVRARLGGPFDLMLCMHVLEHLVDPWRVLRALHPLASPGGRLLALLPNVACWRVRKALFLGGRFEYEDTGILDRTHLRFFTLGSARRLLDGTGWRVVETTSVDVNVPLAHRLGMLPLVGGLRTPWERLLTGRFPNLCTEIVLLDAVRAAEPGEGA